MRRIRSRLAAATSDIQGTWLQMEAGFETYFDRINTIFKDYTLHDRSHLEALETILDWLVPEETWKALTDYDIFILLCGLWGHDIGMGASETEISDYCARSGTSVPDKKDLINFLRVHHAELSRDIVEKLLTAARTPILSGLAGLCGALAHSHHESDLGYFQSSQPVGLSGLHVHPAYLALLIRLADILHCTADRAPYQLMFSRGICDPISLQHWKRHQCTVGIGPNPANGTIELALATEDVQLFAWGYEYFHAIEAELSLAALTFAQRNLRHDGLDLFSFQIRIVPQTPFVARVVRLQVDTPAAIRTLTGRNLYDDYSVVIRELLQNALDACQLRAANDPSYVPKITISYDSTDRLLSVTDNGIGMQFNEITQHLLTSCSVGFRGSGSRSDLISKFGIGFLTVFLVSESISIFTRSTSAGQDNAYRADLITSEQPVAIYKVRQSAPGTTIRIKLQDEVRFQPHDLLKWYPSEERAGWVEFHFDRRLLKTAPRKVGSAKGYEFTMESFEHEREEFRLVLRSVTLAKDKIPIWPCGLSFQSVDRLPELITDTPDVRARIYNNAVPVVNSGGEAPRQLAGGRQQPLVFRYFFPFDLHIKKPGLIDLNLARNAFIGSEGNVAFFNLVDSAATELILKYYNHLLAQGATKGEIATSLIEEYWLSILRRARTPLEWHESLDSDEVFQRMLNIWRSADWQYVSERGTIEVHPLSRSIDSSAPTLFATHEFLNLLVQVGLFARFMDDLKSQFGEFYVTVGAKASRRHQHAPATLLTGIATSISFYDLMHLGTQFPPLVAYYFNPPTSAPTTRTSAFLHGSTKPIAGFTRSFKAIGLQGYNGHQIFLNKLSDPIAIAELLPIFETTEPGQLNYANTGRGTIFDHLRSIGIPDKYLSAVFVENSLNIDLRSGELKMPT